MPRRRERGERENVLCGEVHACQRADTEGVGTRGAWDGGTVVDVGLYDRVLGVLLGYREIVLVLFFGGEGRKATVSWGVIFAYLRR